MHPCAIGRTERCGFEIRLTDGSLLRRVTSSSDLPPSIGAAVRDLVTATFPRLSPTKVTFLRALERGTEDGRGWS
jgi:hypothetical protein